MLTAQAVSSVQTIEDAKRLWPGVLDVRRMMNDYQDPAWEKAGVEQDEAYRIVLSCRLNGDWDTFWSAIAPRGMIRAVCGKNITYDSYDGVRKLNAFKDPGGVVVAILKAVVANRLDSEEPTFALCWEGGCSLYWRLLK